jgi:methionyl-tRNA formyltransferase
MNEIISEKSIVLLTSHTGKTLESAVGFFGIDRCEVVNTVDQLVKVKARRLLTMATTEIIPPNILYSFVDGAFNIHSASPEFPGRDPHNWAIYSGAERYGATLHRMTSRVDEGEIIDVEWFDVPKNIKPKELLSLADAASIRLLGKHSEALRDFQHIPQKGNFQWGGIKRSRKDLINMCRIDADLDLEEFNRRLLAFNSDGYSNLFTEIHGRAFRIES